MQPLISYITKTKTTLGVLTESTCDWETEKWSAPVIAQAAQLFKIGVGAGNSFDASKLSPEIRTAVEQGMADALAELAALQKRIDAKEVTSDEMFGTREYLKNNYLYRMAAAVNGIYGNSEAEAIYPLLALDNEGQKPDGSKRYTLRFAPGQLPPVNAFWTHTQDSSSTLPA
jgi:hypothetical protein